jgi:hypothetical protein
MSVEDVKKFIEEKYKRLSEAQIEYIPVSEIREVFLPYVRDPEEFAKFTDEEIMEFYTEWYKQNVNNIRRTISEMEQPEIEDE